MTLNHEIKFVSKTTSGKPIEPRFVFSCGSGKQFVTFTILVNWVPQAKDQAYWEQNGVLYPHLGPTPSMVQYHSDISIDDNDMLYEDCPYVKGTCHSGQCGDEDEAFGILLIEGEDALWNYLEARFVDTFGEVPDVLDPKTEALKAFAKTWEMYLEDRKNGYKPSLWRWLQTYSPLKDSDFKEAYEVLHGK